MRYADCQVRTIFALCHINVWSSNRKKQIHHKFCMVNNVQLKVDKMITNAILRNSTNKSKNNPHTLLTLQIMLIWKF